MPYLEETMEQEIILEARNITKVYPGGVVANHNVNLQIKKGEIHALVGENGAGKSTLMKMLFGMLAPTEGQIFVDGKEVHFSSSSDAIAAGLGMVHQHFMQVPSMTVAENLILGAETGTAFKVDRKEAVRITTELSDKYNLKVEAKEKVEDISLAMRQKLEILKALYRGAHILILDEPTNHLDSEMADWLEEYLKKFRGALLMITHDRYFLDSVTNRIVELDRGKLYSYQTNYEGFVKLKAERMDMAVASERKRQTILRTELAWMQRGARARSTKQKAHIQRYEALRDMDAPEFDKEVEMESISSRLGRTTVEVKDLCKAYGNKVLLKDFTYIFLKNDRVGIIGPNGSGKSTLMKMIMGILQPDEGNITIGDTVKIGYFAQENEDMTGDIRVIDYIRNVAEYIQTTKGQASASQMLDRFLFPPELQYTPLDKLSGGEQRRLYLLKVLMEAPNVLILDEPTNDLDIQTLTILEDYLDTFAGIVITVSHDRYFLDRIVNRIFAFEEGGHLKQYEGGYTDYLEKVKPIAKQEKSKPEKKENNGKKFQKEHQKKLKFTYKEQKEFETIDDDIAKLEEKIEQLDEEIMENATNSGKLAELTQQKEETEEALNEKMDRWVYLNDLAEQIANQ